LIRAKEAAVLSYQCRFLLALPIVLLSIHASVASPAEKPTAQQIAQWIEQLGDNKFSVREAASKKLWAAGSAAESALEEAAKSEDAEVARRARDILEKFKWGIYPDTPADIVALIKAYQSAEGNTRLEIVQKLLQGGPAGLQAVLKISRNEKDANQRRALGDLVSSKLPAALPRVLEQNDFAKFETLLEIGHESDFIHHNQYAAYWLLRGKLDERIAHFRNRRAKEPDEKRAAETLVYLYRAKGDLAEACKAAEKAKRDDLLDGILYEAADWKALAARKDFHGTQSAVEKLAYEAAFARLADKPKELENALAEIRRTAIAEKQADENDRFVAAKAFFLNDRPEEGLALLAKMPNRLGMQFDILGTRLAYREALALSSQSPNNAKTPQYLDMEKARTLYFLGEKEKAEALFARCAEQIKDGVDPRWVQLLLKEEYRAGLKERAFEHCAKGLSVSPRDSVKRLDGRAPEGLYLSEVFPKQAETAEVWWGLLRQRFKEESAAKTFKRLRELIEGKVAAKEVKLWIEEAERALSAPNPRTPPAAMVQQRQALAEAAVSAGLEDLAVSLLEKADAPETLLRLGDLLAAKKQWAKAAERYRQAWRKSMTSAGPLPLFLAGDALVKAGQEKEGKKLIEQSHWVLLGDASARFTFLRALLERGHTEAAQREADLLLRVSDPNNYYHRYYSGIAARRLAIAAAARKDYLKAADGFEQSMLRCLNSSTSFVQAGAYVAVPAQIHQTRASGLLAAGKFDEAHKHIDLSLTLLPSNVDLPIKLVPELERRGRKKEAAALFERCNGAYETVCRDYPRCAWAHNSAAWMSACCRRNLDKALAHAQKAVELAPDNAGYLDTLAEVHFQRGDKEKAVALQKRVIELDPKKTYFRKQLRRLEAGDPSAERPPENDD
jgi:tetratricopeptide (TPR) repeat protein